MCTASLRMCVVSAGCLFALIGLGEARGQIFRSGVDMVALTVTVTDPLGRNITGLTADDFVVYEDGVAQPVAVFGREEVPLDVAFVVDSSGSMSEALPLVKKGAQGLLSKLRAADRAAVIDVKRGIRITQSLTPDLGRAATSIAALDASGYTALYDGVYMSLREFERERRLRPDLRRQALVVFSDGMDNASHMDFERVHEFARSLDVTIYTIALQDRTLRKQMGGLPRVGSADWEMRALARDTGGVSFTAARVMELEHIYDTIARELVNQYAIGYVAHSIGRVARFRRLSVSLVPPTNGMARTRAGYATSPAQMQLLPAPGR